MVAPALPVADPVLPAPVMLVSVEAIPVSPGAPAVSVRSVRGLHPASTTSAVAGSKIHLILTSSPI
jgi:hypothetical protein